jgi:cyanophycinase-like exopeptidase
MNQQGPLRWIPGTGWLILATPAPNSEVRSQALARADADGVVVYVSFADDRGDALMDDMEDLGALAGYLVDFHVDRGAVLEQQLEHATMLVLETGTSLDAVLATLDADVVESLRRLYERGAVLLIEGLAINAFGRWTLTDSGDVINGLGWLENVFVEPVSSDSDNTIIHQLLQAYDDGIGISIGEGSALVLGGDGSVEVWGQGKVQISLGRQYSQ